MNVYLTRLLSGLGLLFCAAVASAANHVVEIGGPSGNGFSPRSLTIKRGDTVTFVNRGGFHNVVADDNSFRCASTCAPAGSGDPSSSEWSQTLTFNTAGNVPYYCTAHGGPGGIGMAGNIIVEEGGPAFSIGTAISGNWYSPGQSGHGFQLEKVNDTTVIGIWFTFDNNGNHAWIFASGTLDGNRVAMQAVRSRGGRFPPNFDQTQITNPPWGTLTFEFTGCNAGSVQWTSTDPAFSAAGTLPLERVTQVQGTTCP
jgi:plastocyanin